MFENAGTNQLIDYREGKNCTKALVALSAYVIGCLPRLRANVPVTSFLRMSGKTATMHHDSKKTADQRRDAAYI